MSCLGGGDNGELTFLDIISIMSFAIGIANYEENLTQSDKQELSDELSKKIEEAIHHVHEHLSVQDAKINLILRFLEDFNK